MKLYYERFKTVLCFNLPLVVANRIEQLHGLHHAIHFFILSQDKIITRQSNTEYDCSDSLKAMNPLLTLRTIVEFANYLSF